ncbi:hypothetical protein BJ741DRAFT_660582 [Chytriomyces cf. hyalinus JEL632]|nr:hypothetical protein BJ741DRAFT_660582 [Chytriomyces cf. hyalinus JEL632]
MSNLDWCFCGKTTIEGALYCSDRCYFDETGRSIESCYTTTTTATNSQHTQQQTPVAVSMTPQLPTRIHSRSPLRQRPDASSPPSSSSSPMSQQYGSWGNHAQTETGSIGASAAKPQTAHSSTAATPACAQTDTATQNNDALVDPPSPTATNPFASTHYYSTRVTASNLVVAPQPQRHSASSSLAMYTRLYNRNHSGTFSPVSSPPRQSCSPVPSSREATFLSPGRVSSILGHFEQIAEQQHRLRSRSINGGYTSNQEYLSSESSRSLDIGLLGPLKRTTSLIKNLSHIMMDMSSSLSSRTCHSGSCPYPSLVDPYGLSRSTVVSEKRQHEEMSQSLLSETGGDLHASSLGLVALKRRKMVKL